MIKGKTVSMINLKNKKNKGGNKLKSRTFK